MKTYPINSKILKIYCEFATKGIVEATWEEFIKFQKYVLLGVTEIQKTK